MDRTLAHMQPASTPAEALEVELARNGAMKIADLDRIASMNADELRRLWRETRNQDPPVTLPKDLMARALGFWLQEKLMGGLSPDLSKLLASVAKQGTPPSRRVKVGSVIVREYQGRIHEVLVSPEGFSWQRKTYSSLSMIARTITGTKWNGPRFFGLRGSEDLAPSNEPNNSPTASKSRAPIRGGSFNAGSDTPVPRHRGGPRRTPVEKGQGDNA